MITKLFIEGCGCKNDSLKKLVQSNKTKIDKVKEVENPTDLYEEVEEIEEMVNGATAGDFATLEPLTYKKKKN